MHIVSKLGVYFAIMLVTWHQYEVNDEVNLSSLWRSVSNSAESAFTA